MRRWSIIEAPSSLGLRERGVEQLPDALRGAGLLRYAPDVRLECRIAVPPSQPHRDAATGVLNAGTIVEVADALARCLGPVLIQRRFPVVLGGDCSILLGPALALRRRGRFGLCFIDGHADFYSPDAEPNGEAASMELAFVTGHGPDALANLEGRGPLFMEEDVVVFGFRDAETAAEYGSPDVRETAMQVLDLHEVRSTGAREAARRCVHTMHARAVDGFWIHLDADVLSDDVMPAVGYRMPGGMREDELAAALGVLLASPLAVGLDITIYDPTRDDDERSAGRALVRVLDAALAAAASEEGAPPRSAPPVSQKNR